MRALGLAPFGGECLDGALTLVKPVLFLLPRRVSKEGAY